MTTVVLNIRIWYVLCHMWFLYTFWVTAARSIQGRSRPTHIVRTFTRFVYIATQVSERPPAHLHPSGSYMSYCEEWTFKPDTTYTSKEGNSYLTRMHFHQPMSVQDKSISLSRTCGFPPGSLVNSHVKSTRKQTSVLTRISLYTSYNLFCNRCKLNKA